MVSKTPKNSKGSKRANKEPDSLGMGSSPSLSATETVIEMDPRKLEELIQHANLEYQNVRSKIVKEKRLEIEALDSQIKEFMGPFMLIGYDLNNRPVEMISCSSSAEQDAILERLRRLMFKINQNIINSDGADPYGFNVKQG